MHKIHLSFLHDLTMHQDIASKTQIYKVVYMSCAYSLGFFQLVACTLDRVSNLPKSNSCFQTQHYFSKSIWQQSHSLRAGGLPPYTARKNCKHNCM
nr:hypothetical protein Iba_chr14aCG24500 [Ipomoea batatas]